jgi:hypothetical protein
MTLASTLLAYTNSPDATIAGVRDVVIEHLIEAETTTVAGDLVMTGAPDLGLAVNVLAEIAASVEAIAENTAHADVPVVTAALVESTWEGMGMRLYQAEVLELVGKLVTVEQ